LPLPTEKRKPKRALADYSHLIFGPPKIGKTTFCSQMDVPLFLATEPGTNALEVYEYPVPDWKAFCQAAAEIAAGDHPFKTIVIDTVDNLWRFCSVYVRERNGIQHESDLDWGKGWDLVKGEFHRVISKLALLPYGLVLVSHSEEKEFKTRAGTISKYVCSLPKGGREVCLNLVDMILFATSVLTDEGERRVLRTRPSENFEAGGRLQLPIDDPLPLHYPTYKEAFEQAIAERIGQTQPTEKGGQ